MKYIKKKLKDGDVFVTQLSHNHFLNKYGTNFNLNLKTDNTIKSEKLYKDGGFAYDNIRLATPEEKHWLEECIKLDKFISFEEAMKSFVPEYVECIKQLIGSCYELGIIYKVNDNGFIKNDSYSFAHYNYNRDRFKPSTKEAYDTQFVVKEPEFVLPEKWYIQRNSENFEVLNEWENNKRGSFVAFNTSNNCSMFSDKDYYFTKPAHILGYTEITFEQFKKYVLKEENVEEKVVEEKVIEPLPQFKVIETIETITKVENNEGNQFFIGDVVKSNYSEVIHNIKGFKYNVDKTNILAITEKLPGGIGIDKIEHYIESKTDYQILEYKTEGGISCKAPFLADSHQFYMNERCKIYSIKRISDNLIITVGDDVLSKTCSVSNKILSIELINNKIRLYPRNSFYNLEDILKKEVKDETLLEKAKIIEYSHNFKIGDKIKLKRVEYDYNIYTILDIIDNVLFYDGNNRFYEKHFRVLAKNAIKVN